MSVEAVEMDAFADGQVASKLWLCEVLESHIAQGRAVSEAPRPINLWVLGGWYGVLPFLLRARARMPIGHIRSFDIDENATRIANLINKNWEIQQWSFRAITADVGELEYGSEKYGPIPDVIVNTSCEHFESMAWWERLPPGVRVVLQSTDMTHEEHFFPVNSLDEMKARFAGGLRELHYEGEKAFEYPDWSFRHFMLVGVKG